MVMLGAFLFSSKGIFIKQLYAEGLNPGGALALRMSLALPFYAVPMLLMGRQLLSISIKDWGRMAALAFVGYFICSLANFTGLQYISVGLERVILFSYPSLVLIGASLFQKRKPSAMLFIASACSWFGLYLVIREEIQVSTNMHFVLLGSGLVLLSAIIYAGYILLAKSVIERIGARQYTCISMCFSCAFILIHFGITGGDTRQIVVSDAALFYGVVIGIFGTVAPTYILSYGLSKISSSSYAVMSSVGPVATIALSLLMLSHLPSTVQLLGIAISLSGSVMAATSKN
jgi:drug/metabolite transporter (DMT)-like permease